MIARLRGAADDGAAASFGGKANGEVGLATRAHGRAQFERRSDRDRLRRARGREDARRCRLPRAARQCLFRRRPLPSAEAAYKDSLSHLFEPAAGRPEAGAGRDRAGQERRSAGFLDAGRDVLDPADYGLALALAGRPADAIAGARGRRSRDRAPTPASARTSRLPMRLPATGRRPAPSPRRTFPPTSSTPASSSGCSWPSRHSASDQVAALVGVTPAAVDPGQPVRLALNKTDTQLAQAGASRSVAAAAVGCRSEQPVAQSVAAAPAADAGSGRRRTGRRCRRRPVAVADAAPTLRRGRPPFVDAEVAAEGCVDMPPAGRSRCRRRRSLRNARCSASAHAAIRARSSSSAPMAIARARARRPGTALPRKYRGASRPTRR